MVAETTFRPELLLQTAASGDAATLMRDLRVRSLFAPFFFIKVVLGYKELVAHLHFHDSELFIERWVGGARKQWIEWPRGFFKSTNYTIGTSMWVVCPVSEEDTEYAVEKLGIPEDVWLRRTALHNQDATQLLAFETDTNAKKKVGEIRWHFEENQLFRALFPEIAYQGTEQPWNNNAIKIRRKGFAARSEEGTFEAIGAGAALQSRHYDIVWEDDLVGKRATESDLEMDKTIRWHGLLNGAFVDASKQIRFGVSNRWGYSDLNSWVREHEPESEDGFVFYTRSAWELDDEGHEQPIFPERYTIDALMKIKGSMSSYDFSCQYLNSPTMPGEKEIDASTIHRYRVDSVQTMHCSCGVKLEPRNLLRYIHYDPYNAKGVRSSSRPCLAVIGCSTDQHIMLLDYYIIRDSYNKIYDRLVSMNDRWAPLEITYEDVGHQNMTEFYLKKLQEQPEFKKNHRALPRIRACGTHSKAKEIRIRDFLLPAFRERKFACRENHQHFLTSLETFPFKVPDHDYDLLDALAQGAQVWRFPTDENTEQQRAIEEHDFLEKLGQPYSYMTPPAAEVVR